MAQIAGVCSFLDRPWTLEDLISIPSDSESDTDSDVEVVEQDVPRVHLVHNQHPDDSLPSISDIMASLINVRHDPTEVIVDSILSDEGLPRWKHRFAYIRLARILETLDRIIGHERQKGHVSGRRGQGNSTIKRDMYLQAVEGESGKTLGDLRPRWGKRLDKMTGGSLFLAFAYSDKADSMIRDFSVKHDVLENISHQAIQACRQAIGDSGVFPI
ncbi:hypothetical protein E5D57_008134 [Metarhizium anisopliae]|nr:hypothetical protein E5D57_008134 [Metarhizium anisopliae]